MYNLANFVPQKIKNIPKAPKKGPTQYKQGALDKAAHECKYSIDYGLTELALLLCHQTKQATK